MERLAPAAEGIFRRADTMGRSVALSGHTAVEAPGTDAGNVIAAGVVELYRLESGAWHVSAVIEAPNPARPGSFDALERRNARIRSARKLQGKERDE